MDKDSSRLSKYNECLYISTVRGWQTYTKDAKGAGYKNTCRSNLVNLLQESFKQSLTQELAVNHSFSSLASSQVPHHFKLILLGNKFFRAQALTACLACFVHIFHQRLWCNSLQSIPCSYLNIFQVVAFNVAVFILPIYNKYCRKKQDKLECPENTNLVW